MACLIVIDTDVLIDAARNIDTAVQCLEQIQARTGLAISVVTQTAIHLGQPLISKNQRDYQFIEGLQLLSYPSLSPLSETT
jgi:predicted nucleic acid-binding protein